MPPAIGGEQAPGFSLKPFISFRRRERTGR
jgi:hypothetical protein